MPRRSGWALAAGAVGAAVALAVWVSGRLPDGPVPPHWDHTRCARCAMLISEPGFAAQVQRRDGTVLHYDDPGCLLVHGSAARGALSDAHAVWFHHRREDRWLSLDEVGFLPTRHSPMDFGLAAVARSSHPDALGPEQALAAVRGREEHSR